MEEGTAEYRGQSSRSVNFQQVPVTVEDASVFSPHPSVTSSSEVSNKSIRRLVAGLKHVEQGFNSLIKGNLFKGSKKNLRNPYEDAYDSDQDLDGLKRNLDSVQLETNSPCTEFDGTHDIRNFWSHICKTYDRKYIIAGGILTAFNCIFLFWILAMIIILSKH